MFLGNKYVPVFRSFNQVVISCFGQTLHDNWEEKIKTFKKEIDKLKISYTPKIHALIYHVPEFIVETQMALGFFSEQASEQVHHSFSCFSKRFNLSKVNVNRNKNKLLRCVSCYNSQHI